MKFVWQFLSLPQLLRISRSGWPSSLKVYKISPRLGEHDHKQSSKWDVQDIYWSWRKKFLEIFLKFFYLKTKKGIKIYSYTGSHIESTWKGRMGLQLGERVDSKAFISVLLEHTGVRWTHLGGLMDFFSEIPLT